MLCLCLTMHLMYLKNQIEIHWLHYDNTVPSLNAVKILRVRSVDNQIYQYLA